MTTTPTSRVETLKVSACYVISLITQDRKRGCDYTVMLLRFAIGTGSSEPSICLRPVFTDGLVISPFFPFPSRCCHKLGIIAGLSLHTHTNAITDITMGQLLSAEEDSSQVERRIGSVLYDAMLAGGAVPELEVVHPVPLANQDEGFESRARLQELLQQVRRGSNGEVDGVYGRAKVPGRRWGRKGVGVAVSR